MPSLRFVFVGLIGAIAILPGAYAEEHKNYGAELEGFDYPYEVHRFQFTSQGDEVFMAYMDLLPQQPNGRTAVLLHGRNFCAATWENSIACQRRRARSRPALQISAERSSEATFADLGRLSWRPRPSPLIAGKPSINEG
jgi:hypothetical protein